jgi:hypothetical protein
MSASIASLCYRLSRPITFICLAVCIAITILGVSARAWLIGAARSEKSPVAAIKYKSPQIQAGTRVQGYRVAFHSYGFEPVEITRPKGPFALVVENRTELEEPVFRLNRGTGNSVREARVNRKQRKWTDVFDLSPGEYVLTEVNHPNLTCTITVTAK